MIEKKIRGAYVRFGDGDLMLAIGSRDMCQIPSDKLAKELSEAFTIDDPGYLKTLPLHCKKYGGLEEGMFPGNHEVPDNIADNSINIAIKLRGKELTEIYSATALHYIASVNVQEAINFLLTLKSVPRIIFVGNKDVSLDTLFKLFGDNVIHIKTPTENSYSDIDRIEKETLEHVSTEYTLIVTAMGCSGRALQKRLWKELLDGIFLFDFGSLMCVLDNKTEGSNWRAWYDLSGIYNNINKILGGLDGNRNIF